jgi:ABC-2 type transport system permease protein
MLARIGSIIRKECIHIVRNPRTLVIIIVLPLVQLVLLGYAATSDIDHLRTAVWDADKSSYSRNLIALYQASNYFNIMFDVSTEDELEYLLNHGDARAALIIPPGYGRDSAAGRRADILFLIDGTDPQVANIVFSASQGIAQSENIKIIERRMNTKVAEMPGIEVHPRVWYNPNMKSAYFTIPGLVVIILYLFSTLLTSMSIVREREQGTIEQLIVTPIRPIELIVGKVIPYGFVSFFIVLEVLFIAVQLFGLPIQGSLALLLEISALFLLTSLSMGVLISSVTSTQQEAMLLTFATMLPTILLSGFFFPIEAMPGWLQLMTYLIPARFMLVIIRGIILKGVGLEILSEQVLAIALFGIVILLLAANRFKKRLE